MKRLAPVGPAVRLEPLGLRGQGYDSGMTTKDALAAVTRAARGGLTVAEAQERCNQAVRSGVTATELIAHLAR